MKAPNNYIATIILVHFLAGCGSGGGAGPAASAPPNIDNPTATDQPTNAVSATGTHTSTATGIYADIISQESVPVTTLTSGSIIQRSGFYPNSIRVPTSIQ